MPTEVFTADEDRAILDAFEGLRVADVSDGMDFVGLPDTGLMDPEIAPLWKDTDDYAHRFIGIAVTARYVPTQNPIEGGDLSYDDYRAWEGSWYNERSPEPFVPLIREGSALVLDEAPRADVGSIGSYNILAWQLAGAVGIVTNGTARDTDEIITQEVPLYYRGPGRGIRPGRNEIESVNMPVVVGGVLVRPGDVVVGDGDGVIVVPRGVATRVAEFAHRILEGDKSGRRQLYEEAGREADASLQ
ncbi:RraA family protein [Parvularcula dongshanensis]|uniref:Regulator of RNase E activity RraA n=1 Tax=Parvularcula dongshanensis TaxID=1173995 RepID=A0A840I5R4_9PROT|nr:RraA family protein [Parvularcula dongshanensis]MBB4660286.1 regulator of RNase E activity RraA [Parvularcula dongshanensis]